MALTRTNPPTSELYARRRPIFAVAMIGPFLAYLDVTIVNISVPAIQSEFGADIESVSWVINAYTIAFAVPLVAAGRLADQFGRRRFLIGGLLVFTLGSLLCALAQSVEALVAARVMQGVGASALVPIGMATTMILFPPEQRGRGIAIQSMVAASGAAVGPPLGGAVIELGGWEWVFLLNLPFCLLALWGACRLVPETYDLRAHDRPDVVGMSLLGGSIFCLTYALVEGNGRGWTSPTILALFASSATLLIGFAASQRFGRFPMLTPSLAVNRQFLSSCSAFLVFSIGSIGMFFLAVLGMVQVWGYSELEAALATLPLPVGAVAVVPILTRLSDRVAPRLVAIPAVLITALGIYLLTGFPTEPDIWAVIPACFLVGVGVGLANPTFSRSAMGTVTGSEFGLGSGLVNMARQLGIAIGVAAAAASLAAALDGNVRGAEPAIAALADSAESEPEQVRALVRRLGEGESAAAGHESLELQTAAGRIAKSAARDAFRTAFWVALLAALAALPLTLLLHERPRHLTDR